MAGTRVGLDAVLYRNNGSYAAPSWVEIANVKDLTLNIESGDAEVASRSVGWKTHLQTLKDASIEFDLLWDTAATGFSNIRDAFMNRTTLEMLVLDDDYTDTGAQGLRATMAVTNFSRNEPLEDTLSVNVTVKPAPATNAPAWVTSIGGASGL